MREFTLSAATVLALAIATMPAPAEAQGSVAPLPRLGSCPGGYQSGRGGKNPDMCYPLQGAPSVYASKGNCASGYRPDGNYCTSKAESATYIPPTYGSITKANALDRCPVGYWTDEGNLKICSTPYQGKAPASRLKRGAACGAGEVEEWGLYCTSRQHRLTRSEAENTAVADVNNIFAQSGGKTSPQGAQYENTPGIVALFGGGGDAAPSEAASGGSGATGGAGAQATQTCAPSASGAAIGGALAGRTGAAIGGMLGGLGKRRKGGC